MENKKTNNRRQTNNTNKEVLDRKFSQTKSPASDIIQPAVDKNKPIKDYNRRHSCLISISKLDHSKEGSNYIHLNNNNVSPMIPEEDPTPHGKVHKKRKHKGSCDSSSLSSHSSNNGGAISNNLLKKKAEEVKAANNNPFNNGAYSMTNSDNTKKQVTKYESSIAMKSVNRNKNMTTHKDSKESGMMGTEQLGESILPPQMIDNSAVLFSNTKAKKKKFKREGFKNPLQSDIDKSEIDYQSAIDEDKSKISYEGEGEYDGEGESYSSSCSCSSCLREKNADNGVSLKLSQYSYRPTYAGFQKNDLVTESDAINMSKMQDDVDTSYYNKIDMSSNTPNQMTRMEPSVADFSNS